MNKILRAASYIRVSTSEQALHGYSLQAQKEYLESYALSHGMRIVACFADEGQTARKELKKRKAIRELLQIVEQEKIDVILFWKMDLQIYWAFPATLCAAAVYVVIPMFEKKRGAEE